jgi:hypothetical protein
MYTAFYLDEVRNDILKMPSAYAVRYRNVRIAHTKIFPYNIHFFIDETRKQVIITGIVHNKKKDALFLKR